MIKHHIFISYRRSNGGTMARMIRDRLRFEKHYKTFLDVDDINRDDYRKRIRKAISESDIFLLVLSEDSLNRCDEPEDNIRMEIEAAREMGKVIIPVSDQGFTWPEQMPEGMEEIRYLQTIHYSHDYGEAFFEKLYRTIEECPPLKNPLVKVIIGIGCAAAVAVVVIGLIFSFSNSSSPHNPEPTNTPSPSVVPDMSAATETATISPTPQIIPSEKIAGTLFNSFSTTINLSSDDDEARKQIKEMSAFGSAYNRSQIYSITFMDSMPQETPEKPIDVSTDGSIKAWFEERSGGLYDVIIAADGKIQAPANCNYLFAGFSNAQEINFNDCFVTNKTSSMVSMFYDCSMITKLNLSSFDTSNVTNMRAMFALCEKLVKLNLENFNTEKVMSMKSMFVGCVGLKELDIRSFNTKNVTDMNRMFNYCKGLGTIYWNTETFSTSNVIDMCLMFRCCENLSSLNLSHFDTSKVEMMDKMFAKCSKLQTLDGIENWNIESLVSMDGMFEATKWQDNPPLTLSK